MWHGSLQPDTAAIKQWCAAKKVTPFAFAMCVAQQVLRRYCDGSFAIGTAYDTRPPQCAETIGMFVNTVLFPYDGENNSVDAVQKQWLRMLPHASVPYDDVVAKGYGTNVFLACNVGQQDTLSGARAVAIPMDGFDTSAAKFDLSIGWYDASDGSGDWVVGVESGIGEWPRLMERIEHTIACLIGDVPVTLLPGEEEQVLAWGTGPVMEIPDKCIHELFEEQAAAQPDAVALVLGDDEMTYGELDRRSTLLGIHLQGLGVGPDVLVGLMLERSFNMVVGIVGILKAGGAYVPIDAEYPAARIEYILKDSGINILLTIKAGKSSEFEAVFPMFFTRSCKASHVSLSVAIPLTNSTRCIIGTGFMK